MENYHSLAGILVDWLRTKLDTFVFMIKIKQWSKKLLKIALTLFVLLNIICAFQAYKLTHFYETKDAMPSPEKMGFTDKLSAGLFGVKFPKSISVDTFLLSQKVQLETVDKTKLAGWYCTYNNKLVKPKGTVILFHGHGGKKNDLIRESTEFSNLGYNILLIDFRAHGNSDGNTCTIGFEESKDVKAAYDYIAAKGEKNIILFGVSLGAAAILKAVKDDYVHPQKLILEMPFGTLQDAVKGRLKMMNLPQQPLAILLTFWGGVEQGYWAFNFKPQEYAKKVTCPTLLQWGTNDKRVSLTETNTIFQNISSTNKIFVEYKNSGHQSLCKNENEKWKMAISNFLDK
jgi:alpha-beta hydrolase superfamily lysophospholipase